MRINSMNSQEKNKMQRKRKLRELQKKTQIRMNFGEDSLMDLLKIRSSKKRRKNESHEKRPEEFASTKTT
jgi:hypothetical protein